jgi:hypothetical protein
MRLDLSAVLLTLARSICTLQTFGVLAGVPIEIQSQEAVVDMAPLAQLLNWQRAALGIHLSGSMTAARKVSLKSTTGKISNHSCALGFI